MTAPDQSNIFATTLVTSHAKILDVGCGSNKYPGAIGIDSRLRTNMDIIHDSGN